jgi:glycosyltransferase involved in cell wall biosynthesis
MPLTKKISKSYQPLFSLIIPTYNREEPLRLTLERLLRQTYTNLEIIVVDQTQAHEQETLRFFKRSGRKLKVIKQKNPNLPAARNTGLVAAKGEIIAFLDDDCLVEEDYIARIVSHYTQNGVDALVAGVVVDRRGAATAIRELKEKYRFTPEEMRKTRVQVPQIKPIAMLTARRYVFAKVGSYDEFLGVLTPNASAEDLDYYIRCAHAGVRAFVDPALKINHLSHIPGGCGARSEFANVVKEAHFMAGVYVALKNRSAGTAGLLKALAQIYRGYIFPQRLLGFRAFLKRHLYAIAVLQKAFSALNSHPTQQGQADYYGNDRLRFS